MNILSSAAYTVANLLPPDLREPVLGDLAESEATPLGSLLALLNLVARKHLDLWRNWNPWLAAAISLSGSLLLLGASFSLSVNLRPILSGSSAHTSNSLPLQALLLVLWAWTAGFAACSPSSRAERNCCIRSIRSSIVGSAPSLRPAQSWRSFCSSVCEALCTLSHSGCCWAVRLSFAST